MVGSQTVEQVIAEHEESIRAAKAQRDRYRAALEDLVRLKDGPRDEAYRVAKEQAWERARLALR